VAAKDEPEIDPVTKPEDDEQELNELASAENGRRPAGARLRRSIPRNTPNFVPGPAPLGRGDNRSAGGAAPASKNIPEPLSEGQINAMTLPEVTEQIGLIATALERGHPDDATKIRLKNEWNLLWDRKRAGR